MENRNLALGALALGAIGIYAFSSRASAEPVEGATPFSPLEEQDKPTQKKTKIVSVDSLIPSLPAESVWESRGQTFTFTHPLAATNSKYGQYTFKAKLVVDILQSGAYESWEEVPQALQGDYVWELSRQGGSWTVNTSAQDIRGTISKSLLSQSVDSIKPTFDSILSAFGGYKPNYPAVNEGSVQIQSGYFTDTGGQWRYVNDAGNKVSTQQIVLDLNGNQINPAPLKMQVKCEGSNTWTDYGNFITVIGSQIATNENGYKFFPADAPTGYLPSGLPYGCTIPTETKTLPQSIRVVDANGTQVSIDDLIVSGTQVTVPKREDVSAEGYIYTRLFTSIGFPQVQKDGGGYFIMWGTQSNNLQKAYISTLIPGFGAYYARRQVQCTCPGGTKNVGQTVTVYDTNNCPSFTSIADQNKYCGGQSTGGSTGGGSSSGDSGTIGGGLGGGVWNLGGGGGLGGLGGGNFQLNNAEQYINSAQSFIIR